MMQDLDIAIRTNEEALAASLKKSPNIAYQQVNELARFVGRRYSVDLQLHFPDAKAIANVADYGHENVGVVVDKFRKKFPLPSAAIKAKAVEILAGSKAQDAYMYEGKEGLKVLMDEGRIEVLPGSMHFWCKIDDSVISFGDWMFENVYFHQTEVGHP